MEEDKTALFSELGWIILLLYAHVFYKYVTFMDKKWIMLKIAHPSLKMYTLNSFFSPLPEHYFPRFLILSSFHLLVTLY